jgi:hypothetical protein
LEVLWKLFIEIHHNIPLLSVEEIYDPSVSQVQKVLMLANGAFQFDRISNSQCRCKHPQSEHILDLDGNIGCCLFAKGDICICEKFVDAKTKVVTTTTNQGKPPKKNEKLSRREIQDPRLSSYVEQLAQM